MSYLDEKGVNKLWTKCKSKFAPINFRPESVIDYGDTNKTIKIGYSGAGLTASQILYIAGYTNGANDSEHKIKDISKDVLKSWLGYAEVSTGILSVGNSISLKESGNYMWIVFPQSYNTNTFSFTADDSTKTGYHFAIIQRDQVPGCIRYFSSSTALSKVNAMTITFSTQMYYIKFIM